MPLDINIVSSNKYKFQWAEVIGNFKWYACHQAQLDVIASVGVHKITAAFFGTGAGKTAMLPLIAYQRLHRFRQAGHKKQWRCLIVSPSVPIFKRSELLEHLQTVFRDTVYEGKWHGADKAYRNDALNFEIVVATAENDPTRLTGGQYDLILCDEVWAMSRAVFEEVRRRSNIKNAPIVLVSTPNVDDWLLEEVMQPYEAGNKDFYVRQCPTIANPVKSPEDHKKFLDGELIKLGQARYDRMYGGQFSQITGLVYDAFGDIKSDRYPVIDALDKLPRPAVKVFGSIDFGYFPDPFSAHVYVHCDDDLVYCVDEVYDVNLEVDAVGSKLRQLQDKWSAKYGGHYSDVIKGGFFEAFYCDASRPEIKSLVSRYGVSIQNRKIHEILAGIAITDSLFRTQRLKIFKTCPNLIREARSYAWKDNKPRAGNDHAMDSLRYGISSYFDGKPITTIPKEMLTELEQKHRQVDVAKRLGHFNSIEELEAAQRISEAEKLNKWLIHLQNCEDDD